MPNLHRKSRILKKWFRYHFDHKDFRNEGTLHLFSLMALYSYANFRSNKRHIGDQWYMEGPGQWICRTSALPRILRVHSKAQALERMDYFKDAGFLDYEMLDEETGLMRFTISDWQEHCTHLNYNYYSYKGSGFFFFPLSVGRKLIAACRRQNKLLFSELDAIMDLWLHTILNDQTVRGSEYMPVVYYTNMNGQPLGLAEFLIVLPYRFVFLKFIQNVFGKNERSRDGWKDTLTDLWMDLTLRFQPYQSFNIWL